MRLTAAAEILVTHIEAVFSRLNQAQGELEAVAEGVRGRLRVGSFPTATVGFLAETIGTFRERFSSVDLTLADGEPHESIVRLKERELDLAVVFDFDHRALSADYNGRAICLDSDIECADLFDDPFLVLLPRDNPLAARDRIDISDLGGERIVAGPSGSSPWGPDFRTLCQRAGFDPDLESSYRTVDFAALQAIVATGRGLTLVPELATLPEHPGVVRRPLVGGPVRHVRIATLAGVALSSGGLAMVELLHRAVGIRHAQPQPSLTLAG